MASQSRALRCTAKRSVTWLAAFSSRRGCRPAELVEPRDRGLEIALVENLVAVNSIAADYEEASYAPFGVEPFS